MVILANVKPANDKFACAKIIHTTLESDQDKLTLNIWLTFTSDPELMSLG